MKTVRSILFYIWQFTFAIVQNLIGLAMFIAYKAKGAESEKFHNSVITYIDKKNFGGVSLGIFIFINAKREGDSLRDTKIHEYGHTIQSMLLGPLWLFVIALPSVIWCNAPYFRKLRKEKDVSYYKAYCEGWANTCGAWATKERFTTAELINRGRYGKSMYPNRSKRKNIKGRKRNK
ncbi:MAG: hypothetical protein J6A60_00150 [Clostridia bacterium]|nr:hypothetical protein [Clostridia bacterium]